MILNAENIKYIFLSFPILVSTVTIDIKKIICKCYINIIKNLTIIKFLQYKHCWLVIHKAIDMSNHLFYFFYLFSINSQIIKNIYINFSSWLFIFFGLQWHPYLSCSNVHSLSLLLYKVKKRILILYVKLKKLFLHYSSVICHSSSKM